MRTPDTQGSRSDRPGIATADLVIAATAEELAPTLATLNTKRSPMYRDLATPYR